MHILPLNIIIGLYIGREKENPQEIKQLICLMSELSSYQLTMCLDENIMSH